MGLVRLSTAQIWVFGIFCVQTLKLSSEMIKNRKTRLIFHVFFSILLFDCLSDLCNPESFFPSVKKYSHVSIYASRGGSWEKNIQRLQIDCDHT